MPVAEATSTCGAKKRQSDGSCQRGAGWGTDHPGYGYCKVHGGSTRTQIIGAARLEAQSKVPMGEMAIIDPYDALLRCIWIAAGEVQYCSDRIRMLDPDEILVQRREESDVGESTYVKTTSDKTLHAWIIARRHALDSLARYSKMAIDAGVAERQVALAERVGVMIGVLVAAVLDELGLSKAQREVAPALVRKHLTRIAGAA